MYIPDGVILGALAGFIGGLIGMALPAPPLWQPRSTSWKGRQHIERKASDPEYRERCELRRRQIDKWTVMILLGFFGLVFGLGGIASHADFSTMLFGTAVWGLFAFALVNTTRAKAKDEIA
jgi:hypothetical protein